MSKVELEVKKREKAGTSKARRLRAQGVIPAIVYGKDLQALSIEVDYKKFDKILKSEAGHNALITLKIKDGTKAQTLPVLTHGIQRNPLNDQIIHLDFLKIKMEEAIKTKVTVNLIGKAVGVKDDGGILVPGLREVEIKCLPGNIPSHFEMDVSELKIGDGFHVSDLKPEKGIEILTNPEDMLVTIAAPTKEEEVAPTLEEGAVPAEGAAAPAEGAAAPAEGEKPAQPGKAAAPKAEEKAKPEAKGKEKK
ncbi:50S ribosomal protein L25 [Candidatus Margulisiibacteriota bacterium]